MRFKNVKLEMLEIYLAALILRYLKKVCVVEQKSSNSFLIIILLLHYFHPIIYPIFF